MHNDVSRNESNIEKINERKNIIIRKNTKLKLNSFERNY